MPGLCPDERKHSLPRGAVATKVVLVFFVESVYGLEFFYDDVTFGSEIGIKTALGGSGSSRDLFDGYRVKSFLSKQHDGILEQDPTSLLCLLLALCHERYRPVNELY